jgi:alpha-tubulin suppressor-like RCC1 family protein
MPSNYSFTQNGVVYNFDDVFVPASVFGGGEGGSLWLWGGNQSPVNEFRGQLGVNDTINRSTPVTTILGGNNWKDTASLVFTSAAVKTDGTLWVWGNQTTQAGTNDAISRSTPVTTFAGGTNWNSVSGNGYTVMSIKSDGTLWVWATNNFGQLGVNDTNRRSTPVTTILGGNNWKRVDSSSSHSIAIKTDGTLWTWGRNNSGQLGVNDTINRSTPVTTILGGNNWNELTVGNEYSGAIKTDGTLWSWGRNRGGALEATGQLGINDLIFRSTPVTTFLGGTNWSKIASGTYTVSAIKTDGTLWSWGDNSQGQLGTNDTINRNTPVTTILGGNNWKQVDCDSHIVAIKTDGTLWNWGLNGQGHLGINAITNRSTPVTTILGGNSWKSAKSIGSGTIAIRY